MSGSGGAAGAALAVVAPQAAGAVPDRVVAGEMPADEDAEAGAGAAAGLLGQLEGEAVSGHHIVAPDDAFLLDAENLLEVDAAEWDKGGRRVGGRPPELHVERREEALPQVAVGGGHRGDAGEAELVDEAILQGAVDALTAAAGRGRIAEDVFDAQAGEGAADLGQAPAIRGPARHPGVDGPMGAVGGQGHWQAVARQDRPEGSHDGHDAVPAVPEFGIEQALGRIVDDGDEGEPLVGDQGEPAMATAVEMQELAEAGAGLTAPPVAAARAVLGHEAGTLQGLLDEGVAEADAVLAAGEGVEVAEVESLVAVPVEGQQAVDLRQPGVHRRMG